MNKVEIFYYPDPTDNRVKPYLVVYPEDKSGLHFSEIDAVIYQWIMAKMRPLIRDGKVTAKSIGLSVGYALVLEEKFERVLVPIS